MCLACYTSVFLMHFTILALQRNLGEKIDKLGSFVRGGSKLESTSRCRCKLE